MYPSAALFGVMETKEWDERVTTVVPGAWNGVQVGAVVWGRLAVGALEPMWGAGLLESGGGTEDGGLRRLRAVPALAGVHGVRTVWLDSLVMGCRAVLCCQAGSLSL